MVPVNYLAVLVAAIANMVLGYLWYGPLFGKAWAAMMGFTPEKMAEAKAKGMTSAYVIMFIGSLLMSWVLAQVITFASVYFLMYGIAAGLIVGFLMWLGFVAPVTIGSVTWEGKPWKLWYLNSFYYLVGFLVMGIILAIWR